MLELCLRLQPFRSRLAVDNGMIAGFGPGIATLGCAVTALGLSGRLVAEDHPAQSGFMTSILHSRIVNRESWKIGACQPASGSYLESALAEKRGRGAATPTSLPRAQPCLTLGESYSCTRNKINHLE